MICLVPPHLFSLLLLPLYIWLFSACISLSADLWQTPEELDDSDFEPEDSDARSVTSVQTENDQLIAGQTIRVS